MAKFTVTYFMDDPFAVNLRLPYEQDGMTPETCKPRKPGLVKFFLVRLNSKLKIHALLTHFAFLRPKKGKEGKVFLILF